MSVSVKSLEELIQELDNEFAEPPSEETTEFVTPENIMSELDKEFEQSVYTQPPPKQPTQQYSMAQIERPEPGEFSDVSPLTGMATKTIGAGAKYAVKKLSEIKHPSERDYNKPTLDLMDKMGYTVDNFRSEDGIINEKSVDEKFEGLMFAPLRFVVKKYLGEVKEYERSEPYREEKKSKPGLIDKVINIGEILDPAEFKQYLINDRIEKLKKDNPEYGSALERGDLGYVIDQAIGDYTFVGDEVKTRQFNELKKQFQNATKDPLSSLPPEEMSKHIIRQKSALKNVIVSTIEMLPPMAKSGAKTFIPVVGKALSFYDWMRQGAGQISGDLLDAGVDFKTVQEVAPLGAAIYSAIEYTQFGQITNIGKQAGKELTKQAVIKIIVKHLKDKSLDALKESGEEGLQKITTDITTEIGKLKGGVSDKTTKNIIWDALKSGVKESVQTLPQMGLLSFVGFGAGAAKEIVSQPKKLVDVPLPAPQIPAPKTQQVQPQPLTAPLQPVEQPPIVGHVAPPITPPAVVPPAIQPTPPQQVQPQTQQTALQPVEQPPMVEQVAPPVVPAVEPVIKPEPKVKEDLKYTPENFFEELDKEFLAEQEAKKQKIKSSEEKPARVIEGKKVKPKLAEERKTKEGVTHAEEIRGDERQIPEGGIVPEVSKDKGGENIQQPTETGGAEVAPQKEGKIKPIKSNWEIGEERPFVFDPNSTKNEGRFRLKPPEKFKNYFKRKSSTKGISYVIGIDKITGKEAIQAIRFNKNIFTEDFANKWFKENKSKYKFNEISIKAETEAPPTVKPVEKEKQLWEMTRKDFSANQGKDNIYVQQQRDAIVKQAIKDGKPVPAEVLKDYPELKAKIPAKVEQKAIPAPIDFGYTPKIVAQPFIGGRYEHPKFTPEYDKLSPAEKFGALQEEKRVIQTQIGKLKSEGITTGLLKLDKLRAKLTREQGKYSVAGETKNRREEGQLEKFATTGVADTELQKRVEDDLTTLLDKFAEQDLSELNKMLKVRYSTDSLKKAVNAIKKGRKDGIAAKDIRKEIGGYLKEGVSPTRLYEDITSPEKPSEDKIFFKRGETHELPAGRKPTLSTEETPEYHRRSLETALAGAFDMDIKEGDIISVDKNKDEQDVADIFKAIFKTPVEKIGYSDKVKNAVDFDGVTVGGVIFYSDKADKPVFTVAAHETLHILKQRYPDKFKGLIDYVHSNLTEKGIAEVDRRNKRGDKDGAEEILADFGAEQMTDPEWWKRLYSELPDVAKKLLETLLNVIDRIINKMRMNKTTDNAWFKDIKLLRNAFNQTMKDILAIEADGKVRPKPPIFSRKVTEIAKEKEKILPQPENKTLIAVHNLNQDSIEFVDKIGGIPAPSLAITKPEIPFESYGDVTLIADKKIITPETLKIFNADIYSGRSPTIEYDVSKNNVNDFNTKLWKARRKYQDTTGTFYLEEKIENNNRTGFVSESKNDVAVKGMFLESHNISVEPVLKTKQPHPDWTIEPELREWYKTVDWDKWNEEDYNGSYKKDVRESYEDAIKKYLKRILKDIPELIDDEKILEQYTRVYITTTAENIRDYNKDTKEVDKKITEKNIDSEIDKIGRDKFHQWIEDRANKLFIYPHLKIGREKREVSLENMVEATIRSGLRGKEKNMVYGLGQARGAGAKRLKSIQAMHKEEGRIITKEEAEKIYDENQKTFFKLQERVDKYYKYSRSDSSVGIFDRLDSLSKAIGDYLKGPKTTSAINRSLWKNDYINVPDHISEELKNFADEIGVSPTQYFEAKPERAVYLNEFSGAVIPKNTSENVRKILTKNGISSVEYDPKTKGDRTKKVKEFSINKDLMFARKEPQKFTPETRDMFAGTSLERRSPTQIEIEARQKRMFGGEADVTALPLFEGGAGIIGGTEQTALFSRKDYERTIHLQAFKNWFGDRQKDRENASKIVDDKGRPLVVFHGTTTEHDFTRFEPGLSDIGMHFGTSGQANDRIEYLTKMRGRNVGIRVYPVFLNIRKPLRMKDVGWFNADNISSELKKGKLFTDEELTKIENYKNENQWLEDLKDLIISKGYDGIVYANEGETTGGSEKQEDADKAWIKVKEEFVKLPGKQDKYTMEFMATPLFKKAERLSEEAREYRLHNAEDSYIAFFPQQIKSAIGNRGTYSPKDSDIRFSRKAEDIFFSPTLRAVENSKQERGTGDQMFAMITKTPGVKEAEWKWMGLDDFLKGKQSVTRQEIEEFVRQNQVEIKEVKKTEVPAIGLKWERSGENSDITTDSKGNKWKIEATKEKGVSYGEEIEYDDFKIYKNGTEAIYSDKAETLHEAKMIVAELVDDDSPQGDAKYGPKGQNQVLPGGENYREELLTLPTAQEKTKIKVDEFVAQKGISKSDFARDEELRNRILGEYEDYLKTIGTFNKFGSENTFKSSHWSEPNVIAHTRLNDRTSPNGEKVLFVEEIQSDWEREAREKGVSAKKDIKYEKEIENKTGLPFGQTSTRRLSEIDATSEEIERYEQYVKSTTTPGVPNQPFLKNWTELTLKRILRMAAEEGYDRVAWINGQQTADRYDLSKQVDAVIIDRINDDYMVSVRGLDGSTKQLGNYKKEKLPEVIGKDIAEKVVNEVENGDHQTYSGLDLKIGGEWATNLYDRMIPKYLEKYGKKWGVKVEDVNLGEESSFDIEDMGQDGWVVTKNGEPYVTANRDNNASKEDAERQLEELIDNKTKIGIQQSIPITEQMRQSVMYEGQPMFSRKKPTAEANILKEEKLPDIYKEVEQQRDKSIWGSEKSFRKIADSTIADILVPVSRRLKEIAPVFKERMRLFEFAYLQQQKEDLAETTPFMDAFKKMVDIDQKVLDRALKNADPQVIDLLVNKYNISKEYQAVRKVLDGIHKRAVSVGFDVNYVENYWPRKVLDYDGLYNYAMQTEQWAMIEKEINRIQESLDRPLSQKEKAEIIDVYVAQSKQSEVTPPGVIESAILREEENLGHLLSETERERVVNSVIAGPERIVNMPGGTKERSIELINNKIDKFYDYSMSALVTYIHDMDQQIEVRKFLGMDKTSKLIKMRDQELAGEASKTGNEIADIQGGIDSFVLNAIRDNNLTALQQDLLVGILRARFNYQPSTNVIQTVKDLGYMTSMASGFSSFITQIGDLAWAYKAAGPINATNALISAIKSASAVTKIDLGLERIAEEFRTTKGLGKALNKMFDITLLTKMDNIGKETLINGVLEKYRQKARSNDKTFAENLKTIFGEDEGLQTFQDFKEGKINYNIKYMLFSRLLDFQPMTQSEMPLTYLRRPNGRIFYMLKTFTIKQLDAFRTEGMDEIERGIKEKDNNLIIKGVTNLSYAVALFIMANAGADAIKDWLFGRKPSFHDKVWDNILRLFGLSRYIAWEARREGIVMAIMKLILPPMDIIEAPAKDARELFKRDGKPIEVKIKNAETWKIVPYIGKHYYWWFGGGHVREQKRQLKDLGLSYEEFHTLAGRLEGIRKEYESIKKTDRIKAAKYKAKHLQELRLTAKTKETETGATTSTLAIQKRKLQELKDKRKKAFDEGKKDKVADYDKQIRMKSIELKNILKSKMKD